MTAAPGDDLQAALDLAATATDDRRLILLPGVHYASRPSFCLLAVTARHEGVTIEGREGTILSGRSASDPERAVVSHVLYCGHGLTEATQIRHLVIRDAGGVAISTGVPREFLGRESAVLQRGLFFQLDGGAVKVFGNSSPVFDAILFENNATMLCGGAVSIEHQGVCANPVQFLNCRFIGNRCPATGSAVDVLEGSLAQLENCLFVGNIGNTGMEDVKNRFGLTYNAKHGSGALTVFPGSRARVSRCTFWDNWNGVDDHGPGSQYSRCLFIDNDASDGSRPGHPYEVDIIAPNSVVDCVFHAKTPDLRGTVSADSNTFLTTDPSLDEHFVPAAESCRDVGYRPLP
ncbi:MAG: hypothetical protein NXI04_13220 [Planctomycetaceae bacterium]|nr:hypothetical protein [Planctomycetaceae bacterium]